MSRSSFLGLTLALAAAPLTAQAAPSARTLANPEEFAQSFDQVTSFRELPGGKVLLVDMGPKTLLLADFKTGQHTTIGRNGQGPGEYQFPGELIPYLGDTTLLVDRVSRRMLPVATDGKLGKVIAFPDAIGGIADPRGSDSNGRLYFQASPFGMDRREGPQAMPDSAAVIRWDRAGNKVDTITRVKLPSTKMQVTGGDNARMVMMRAQPYAGQDEWAVGRDGRIAVARVADYHVDWVGDKPARGAAVRFDRVSVGAAERDAFMVRSRDTRGRMVITTGGGGRAPDVKPPEPKAEDFDWPEYKPPFIPRNSGGASYVSPEGQLWLQRSRPAQDSVPAFDLFDASGNLTGRVLLPKGRRLVGLGQGTAYAVRTDEDGLQWLERYRR